MASFSAKSFGKVLVKSNSTVATPNISKCYSKNFSTNSQNTCSRPNSTIKTTPLLYNNYQLSNSGILFCELVSTPSSSFRSTCCLVQKHNIHLSTNLEAPRRAGFFGKLYESVKEELEHNKDIKSSIDKFRKETSKLDESDALKSARKKYEAFEEETSEKGKVLKEKVSEVSEKVKEGFDEFKKSEIGQQTSEVFENVGKGMKSAGETISKSGRIVLESEAFKTVSEASEVVRKNIDEELSRARIYSSPKILKRRADFRMFSASATETFDPETHDVNESELRMELHKDARWYASWQNFKDTNPVMNKMFDLKTRFDESENSLVAGTRFVSDKVYNIFSGFLTPNATSKVMSEIRKVDPNFTITRFNDVCHKIIYPHVVEALFHVKLDLLEDWLTAPAYSKVCAQLDPLLKQGYTFHSHVMDVGEPDIETAIMDQSSPILVSMFNIQAVCHIKDKFGKVITLPDGTALIGGGEEGKVDRYFCVVALTRDMDDLDPISSWRIGDIEIRKMKMSF